jgi:hypothetical protein
MRSSLGAIIAALVAVSFVSLISTAQAGSSQSAPTKYSHNPNRVVSPVVWTRPVAVREFSSSRPAPRR